jgi:hypothetical protein
MVTPDEVLAFIEENKDIPAFFEVVKKPDGTLVTQRKRNKDAPFPVWPQNSDPDNKSAPLYDPEQPPVPMYVDGFELDGENVPERFIDVFLAARSWFRYAQDPLPPPVPDHPEKTGEITNPIKQHIPPHMMTLIFRSRPARAQSYVAERIAEEGWFDEEGWELLWDVSVAARPMRLGQGLKWGQESWQKAYAEWLALGTATGIELSPERLQYLTQEAEPYRQKYLKTPADRPTKPADEDEAMQQSYEAAAQLHNYGSNRQLLNFAHHFHRAGVEQQERTVAARKALHETAQAERRGVPPETLMRMGEAAMEQWLGVLVVNPEFAGDSFMQDSTNDLMKRFLDSFLRSPNGERIKGLMLAEMAAAQTVPADLGMQMTLAFRSARPRVVVTPEGVVDSPLDNSMRFLSVLGQLGGSPQAGLLGAAPRLWAGPAAIVSPEGPLDSFRRPVYKAAERR